MNARITTLGWMRARATLVLLGGLALAAPHARGQGDGPTEALVELLDGLVPQGSSTELLDGSPKEWCFEGAVPIGHLTPWQHALASSEGRAPVDVARIARADLDLFLWLRVSPAAFLRPWLTSIPGLDALLEVTEEFDGELDETEVLLAEIDRLFGDEVTLLVRPNDYPSKAEWRASEPHWQPSEATWRPREPPRPLSDPDWQPPTDGRKVAAWTAVLRLNGSEAARERMSSLFELAVQHQRRLGIAGPNADTGGVFCQDGTLGGRVWEYCHSGVPGTGCLTVSSVGDRVFVSNSTPMLWESLSIHVGAIDTAILSDHPAFRSSRASPRASAVLWLGPRLAREREAEIRARLAALGDDPDLGSAALSGGLLVTLGHAADGLRWAVRGWRDVAASGVDRGPLERARVWLPVSATRSTANLLASIAEVLDERDFEIRRVQGRSGSNADGVDTATVRVEVAVYGDDQSACRGLRLRVRGDHRRACASWAGTTGRVDDDDGRADVER